MLNDHSRDRFPDGADAISGATLKALAESDIIGIILADRFGSIIDTNDYVLRMLGFERDDLVSQGIRWRELTPPEYATRDEQALLEAESMGSFTPFEKEYLRKDGGRVPVLLGGALLPTSPELYACFVLDLTDRRRAEEALHESSRRVTNIVESLTDAFFALDHDWRFTYLNHQAELLLARSREEVLGRSVWEEFPEAVGSTFDEQYHRAVEGGTPVSFDEFYPPLGTWFEVHAYPSNEGLSVYFSDIGERVEAQRQLRDALERAEAAAERTARLQSVSAALSEALTATEVAGAVLTQGIAALGASAGNIVSLSEEPGELQLLATYGYPERAREPYMRFPIGAPVPLAQAVRTGEPVWIESAEEWGQRYPSLQEVRSGLGTNATASIPLLVKGTSIGALGLSFRETHHFSDDERTFILSLASQCAQALERSRLYEAEGAARARAEAAQRRFAFLAEASQTLAGSLDYETTLKSVAHLAVPHVADWCAVYMVEGEGDVRCIAVAHVDPAKVALAMEMQQRYPLDLTAPTGVANVLRTGKPELVPFIPEGLLNRVAVDEEMLAMLHELGLVSGMTVPMVTGGRVLGAIMMISAESGRRYGDEDLALALDLAGRAAVAVDNARLHREAQQAALEREAILGQITDGIVISDESGTIVFANTAAERILGLSPVGLWLERYTEVFRAANAKGTPIRNEDLPLARAVLNHETVVDEDVVVRPPGAGETVLQCSATPVIGSDGRQLGAVVTFRDVTMQRSLERQKDDFLSAAAHDLKTPLTTIKGLAQILERRAMRAGTPETQSLLDGLGRIDTTSSRMTALINELLDVSRIQLGRPLDLVRAPMNLVELAERIVAEQRHVTERHTLVLHAEEPSITGPWDSSRLERAITNLLSNAITYSPDGGRIQVTVGLEQHGAPFAVLSVQDEGLGIPEPDMPRIFERFHRGGNVSGRIPGTGIGLAGAAQIIHQHGGTIGVESSEGHGSTFTIRLPLHATDAEAEATKDRARDTAARRSMTP